MILAARNRSSFWLIKQKWIFIEDPDWEFTECWEDWSINPTLKNKPHKEAPIAPALGTVANHLCPGPTGASVEPGP